MMVYGATLIPISGLLLMVGWMTDKDPLLVLSAVLSPTSGILLIVGIVGSLVNRKREPEKTQG